MARPISPTGNTFSIGITRQNFDPTDLTESNKVKKFIEDQTGVPISRLVYFRGCLISGAQAMLYCLKASCFVFLKDLT